MSLCPEIDDFRNAWKLLLDMDDYDKVFGSGLGRTDNFFQTSGKTYIIHVPGSPKADSLVMPAIALTHYGATVKDPQTQIPAEHDQYIALWKERVLMYRTSMSLALDMKRSLQTMSMFLDDFEKECEDVGIEEVKREVKKQVRS